VTYCKNSQIVYYIYYAENPIPLRNWIPLLLSCGMLRKINLPLSKSSSDKLIKVMAVPESGEVIPL
jgi:hypothetical protein